MSNRYFRYWSINEPVFLSNEKEFFSGGPFQPILDRLTTQLYVGMKIQVLQGPASCGKTTLLRQISQSMPVEEWDVLYLGTVSFEAPSQSLSQKLLRFIDTTSEEDGLPALPNIVTSLERLSKSKRKILILLDIHETTTQLQELEAEIARLFEVVTYHNLPLYLIAGSPLNRLKTAKNSSEWTGNLRALAKEEASAYLKWCLSRAQIDSDLFSEELISKLYKEANGSLLKLCQLAESVLIDLSLNQHYNANIDPSCNTASDEPTDQATDGETDQATDEGNSAINLGNNDQFNKDKSIEYEYDAPLGDSGLEATQFTTEPDNNRGNFDPSINLALEVLKKQSEVASLSAKSLENRTSADPTNLPANLTTKNLKTKVIHLDHQSKAVSNHGLEGQADWDPETVTFLEPISNLTPKTVTIKESKLEKQALGGIEKIEDVKKTKKGSNPLVSLISLTKGI